MIQITRPQQYAISLDTIALDNQQEATVANTVVKAIRLIDNLYSFPLSNHTTTGTILTPVAGSPCVTNHIITGIAEDSTATAEDSTATTGAWTATNILVAASVSGFISNTYAYGIHQLSKKELFRQKIRFNLNGGLEASNGPLMSMNNDQAELRARRLLRDMIGDLEFKRYLVRGFITVKGRSGTIYKINGCRKMIESYIRDNNGNYYPHEHFCIVFKEGKLPFTDWVIMRKLLIDWDEFGMRKIANVFPISRAPQVGAA